MVSKLGSSTGLGKCMQYAFSRDIICVCVYSMVAASEFIEPNTTRSHTPPTQKKVQTSFG